jgi:hypothetical protein
MFVKCECCGKWFVMVLEGDRCDHCGYAHA